jgi:ActR/RegA family two-component response regulator
VPEHTSSDVSFAFPKTRIESKTGLMPAFAWRCSLADARILFVDDEAAIRETLPRILTLHGYDVFSVGTVAAALAAITSRSFDVLITDLNIGQPGDGFTVVSGMRRTQPDCINFILTGYPALETALEAIRSQVDGCLMKPTSVSSLLAEIEEKLKNPVCHQPLPCKRLSGLLREFSSEIVQRTLALMEADPELMVLGISEEDRVAPIGPVLGVLADVLDSSDPNKARSEVARLGAQWAKARHRQGFPVPLLIKHVRLLESAIFDLASENLLLLNLSYFLTDLKRVNQTLFLLLENLMKVFQELDQKAA